MTFFPNLAFQVKKLLNENGQAMNEAGPGTAVEIIGWKELAHPGEQIVEAKSEASWE